MSRDSFIRQVESTPTFTIEEREGLIQFLRTTATNEMVDVLEETLSKASLNVFSKHFSGTIDETVGVQNIIV